MKKGHILICAHPSTRLPGKNRMLFPYTARYIEENYWLLKENGFDVQSIGWKSEIPKSGYPHTEYHNESHRDVVWRFADMCDPEDLIVLLQLTQPVRSANMLRDCIEHHLKSDLPCFSSVKSRPGVIDGALYSALAKDHAEIFNHDSPHGWIVNDIPRKIDIDTPEDMNDFQLYLAASRLGAEG